MTDDTNAICSAKDVNVLLKIIALQDKKFTGLAPEKEDVVSKKGEFDGIVGNTYPMIIAPDVYRLTRD
ncbi:MAG: hypothetical protein KJO98_12995 [Rhodothermia bacterium]|nr:hypothetical protein [Rhodothermia bacterium]